MSSGILLLEFALLGFIAAVYLIARRNLTAAAAREQAETAHSLREVQETITSLISVLQAEAAVIEERLSEQARQIETMLAEQQALVAAGAVPTMKTAYAGDTRLGGDTPSPQDAAPHQAAAAFTEGASTAIESALRLIANGETSLTAARQTALTVTEVEIAARMRRLQRQMPPAAPTQGEPS